MPMGAASHGTIAQQIGRHNSMPILSETDLLVIDDLFLRNGVIFGYRERHDPGGGEQRGLVDPGPSDNRDAMVRPGQQLQPEDSGPLSTTKLAPFNSADNGSLLNRR
jgi:hypothetical protein